MKARIYTEKEINTLENNVFIKKVKYKRELEYFPVFKLWCILMKIENPDLSAREIFERGGLDINILHHKLPRSRIKEWMDNYKKYGIAYFLPEDNSYFTIEKDKVEYASDNYFLKELEKYICKRLKEINYV